MKTTAITYFVVHSRRNFPLIICLQQNLPFSLKRTHDLVGGGGVLGSLDDDLPQLHEPCSRSSPSQTLHWWNSSVTGVFLRHCDGRQLRLDRVSPHVGHCMVCEAWAQNALRHTRVSDSKVYRCCTCFLFLSLKLNAQVVCATGHMLGSRWTIAAGLTLDLRDSNSWQASRRIRTAQQQKQNEQ